MHILLFLTAMVALLLNGAIFGFFYAYFCSAMWGLDVSDPKVALAAMQGINLEVRNGAFFPSFFLTPVALAAAAILAWRAHRPAVAPFALAALVYFGGGLLLTMLVNVPMNEALALVDIPDDPAEAQAIWDAYSPPWQFWNAIRMVASGIALGLTGWGLVAMGRSMPS